MAPTLYYYIYYVHQVQVFHDLLGLYDKKVPRFSHQFARLEGPMTAALQEYVRAVKTRGFPQPRHAFSMPKTELLAFEQARPALPSRSPQHRHRHWPQPRPQHQSQLRPQQQP